MSGKSFFASFAISQVAFDFNGSPFPANVMLCTLKCLLKSVMIFSKTAYSSMKGGLKPFFLSYLELHPGQFRWQAMLGSTFMFLISFGCPKTDLCVRSNCIQMQFARTHKSFFGQPKEIRN